jgi:hypothetical protein
MPAFWFKAVTDAGNQTWTFSEIEIIDRDCENLTLPIQFRSEILRIRCKRIR